ncbi:DUF2288 family protein [bacterium]|jgi:hypothetical protein|nr:DUF2288 family protein [bacterium]
MGTDRKPSRELIEQELQKSIDRTTWADLRTHLVRDVIILVSPELPLLEAALGTATDDEAQVAAWIRSGLLKKPSHDQLEAWEKDLDRPFLMVVVQPFILIQILN